MSPETPLLGDFHPTCSLFPRGSEVLMRPLCKQVSSSGPESSRQAHGSTHAQRKSGVSILRDTPLLPKSILSAPG